MTVDEQLKILKRGVVEIVSEDGLREKLEKSQKTGKPLKIKLGLDPTAPDIHLGFAVVLRKLRQFQDLGHEVILIIGDFTGMIGDPSGKSITRPQLTPEQVAENARAYEEQLFRIMLPEKTTVRYNSEWLGKLNFADVIRLSSKVTVARILERDDFQKRLAEGRPLSLHEIMYPLCQAYDSVAIESDVELGGTDQTFNILMGRDLQREFGLEPQVALFTPLLVGLDGVQKMSKSLGNYIGIKESPKEMFGKAMSIPDEVMHTYFELATSLPMDEVEIIMAGHPMTAKKRLASEIVKEYHGAEEAEKARSEFEQVFSQRELPTDIPEVNLSEEDLKEDGGIWIARLLTKSGLASGTGEAKRQVQQGAVKIDEQKFSDPEGEVKVLDGMIVRMGRRKFAKIRIS